MTPIVSFYAFYHHHHSINDNWLPPLSYHDSVKNPYGTHYILLAHWYSFSFFNIIGKFPVTLLTVMAACYYAPFYCLAGFLGYELGQFFIPVFHGYGHRVEHQILSINKQKTMPLHLMKKINVGFNHCLLFLMNKLHLLATPKQHAIHHKSYHTTPYVYRSFSSSGIYFSSLDKLLDKLYVWGFSQLPIKAFDKLRRPTLMIVITILLLPYAIACLIK